MNPGPSALEASTLPLGYRGGDEHQMRVMTYYSLPIYSKYNMTFDIYKKNGELRVIWNDDENSNL